MTAYAKWERSRFVAFLKLNLYLLSQLYLPPYGDRVLGLLVGLQLLI